MSNGKVGEVGGMGYVERIDESRLPRKAHAPGEGESEERKATIEMA